MNSPDVAERFASALDADDFLEAAHLLEEDCLYSTHGREIRGREHVMASFVEASDWAHANLDKITYEHTLVHSQAAATIRFVDIFEHRARRFDTNVLCTWKLDRTTASGALLSRIYPESENA